MRPSSEQLLIFLEIVSFVDATFRVRKCCGEGEISEISRCTPLDSDYIKPYNINVNATWPWWFPRRRKIFVTGSDKPIKGFPADVVVAYGSRQPCCKEDSAFLPAYTNQFFDDGSMMIEEDYFQTGNITYPPMSYCVDRMIFKDTVRSSEELFTIQLCPCVAAVCTLKCCGPSMSLYVFNTSQDDVVFSHKNCLTRDNQPDLLPEVQGFMQLHRFPHCKSPDEILSITAITSPQQYELFDNGSAVIRKADNDQYLEKMKFCVENVVHQGKEPVKYVFSCTKRDETAQAISAKNVLYGTLSAIGATFLLATILIFTFLISEWTVNDKNLMAQVWSLFFGYISLSIAQFGLRSLPHALCIILGYVIMYSFLASFFWLNVLCVDLAWTFSEVRMIKNLQAWQKRRRFCQYSMYAWISPAIIVFFAVTLDHVPNLPPGVLKTDFSTKCWFSNESHAKLAYFYGPVAVLLAANLILFIYTIYKIRAVKRQTSRLLQERNTEKVRTSLYIKLFCLMGLSWAFELISWLIGGPDYFWYLTDMANLLRAIFIFATLCWKREVLEQIQDRFIYCRKRGRQTASPSIDTAHSTISLPGSILTTSTTPL